MTLRNLTFGFLVFTVAILSAASQYKIELLRPTMVGSTQLKPGNYTLEVDGGKAIIKNGKNVVAETTVTAETVPYKVDSTWLLYSDKAELKAIFIKGTSTKYVIN